jgi:hypothetical protein
VSAADAAGHRRDGVIECVAVCTRAEVEHEQGMLGEQRGGPGAELTRVPHDRAGTGPRLRIAAPDGIDLETHHRDAHRVFARGKCHVGRIGEFELGGIEPTGPDLVGGTRLERDPQPHQGPALPAGLGQAGRQAAVRLVVP